MSKNELDQMECAATNAEAKAKTAYYAAAAARAAAHDKSMDRMDAEYNATAHDNPFTNCEFATKARAATKAATKAAAKAKAKTAAYIVAAAKAKAKTAAYIAAAKATADAAEAEAALV